ncbi:MAG: hypothetical protein ACREFX_08395, partial [Opitutaceae bacterium]
VLASYRFELPLSTTLAWHIGASVGDTFESTSGNYGPNPSGSAFTFGAQTDLTVRMAENTSIVVGAKVLHLDSTAVTTSGRMSVLQVGLNLRF